MRLCAARRVILAVLTLSAKANTGINLATIPPLNVFIGSRRRRWRDSRLERTGGIEAEVIDVPTFIDGAVGQGEILGQGTTGCSPPIGLAFSASLLHKSFKTSGAPFLNSLNVLEKSFALTLKRRYRKLACRL